MNSRVLKLLAFSVLATNLESAMCNTDSETILPEEPSAAETGNPSAPIQALKISDESAVGYIENSTSSCKVEGKIQARVSVTWEDDQKTFNLFKDNGETAPESERTFRFTIQHNAGNLALKVSGLQKLTEVSDTSTAFWYLSLKNAQGSSSSTSSSNPSRNEILPVSLVLMHEDFDVAIKDEVTPLCIGENISGTWELLIDPETENIEQKKGEYGGSVHMELIAIE